MNILLINFVLIISSIIFVLNWPMSIGLILLVQTNIIILISNNIMYTSWFTIVTFLIIMWSIINFIYFHK